MKKLYFYITRAAKGWNGCNKQFFGYCWGFWFPRIMWNKGLPWRDNYSEVSLLWLIFRFNMVIS